MLHSAHPAGLAVVKGREEDGHPVVAEPVGDVVRQAALAGRGWSVDRHSRPGGSVSPDVLSEGFHELGTPG